MASELVPVEQVDREAAADLFEYLAGGLTASSRKMRKSEADDYQEVQAFARHRLAALEAQASLIAELEAGLRELTEAAAEVSDFLGERDWPQTQQALDGYLIAARALLRDREG